MNDVLLNAAMWAALVSVVLAFCVGMASAFAPGNKALTRFHIRTLWVCGALTLAAVSIAIYVNMRI
jgi:hypothetical protein